MNRLKEHRELAGLSQPELARRSGVSQPKISQIETQGHTPRSPLVCDMIARALKVPADTIFPDPVFVSKAAPKEPVPMTRTICPWCGLRYSPEQEVKIAVGENVIKTYGHLSCLEEDVRSNGLELKKRGYPR